MPNPEDMIQLLIHTESPPWMAWIQATTTVGNAATNMISHLHRFSSSSSLLIYLRAALILACGLLHVRCGSLWLVTKRL